ncbi:O-methyltransferase [Fluviicola sp.]|uniref:O-methyltransferase n=1 Tax=Fluviicola sp. TaxID=1917219 RepID=UPI003D2CD052
MAKNKITGATIPYQLRPLKAIERNLFTELLKRLDSSSDINLNEYRYVGFGAAFLEDFKQLHLALHIIEMDCIEMDAFAFTRQKFNNPYSFINLYNESSTTYINEYFKSDKGQIIWLDYASPRHLAQQLLDIEMMCSKVAPLDIIKFTFNSEIKSFISSHGVKKENKRWCYPTDTSVILEYLKANEGLNKYLPEVTHPQIVNFDQLIRAMCVRAIKRGLSVLNKNLTFLHLAAFTYADGQEMTTITGIICNEGEESKILSDTKLENWQFYTSSNEGNEFIEAMEISAPAMTASERIVIDRLLSDTNEKDVASKLEFKYGIDEDEHRILIDGYRKFYRYLPYYSKIIY